MLTVRVLPQSSTFFIQLLRTPGCPNRPQCRATHTNMNTNNILYQGSFYKIKPICTILKVG